MWRSEWTTEADEDSLEGAGCPILSLPTLVQNTKHGGCSTKHIFWGFF